ncbi:hypothetical protein B5G52_21685 [Pseudoalteromonas sp. A601]|uniref:hypothetical protein n=1 Tax=Pseudoalteromonas sp. A601 TaxID=1967839 RepID=UPI000B3CFB0F|nr:hypothetical protein [Pseudoalteromonas sp. A601]OUS67640.1 hypothetical protein B5G52_21685 [Pseudoalteromonas sp. A601]
MENFKQGLNQFWVGAVFGVCLALSLVLIPVAIVLSTVNDVLKITEFSTLVTQVSQMVEHTQDKIASGTEKLSSPSIANIDKRAFQKVMTAIQEYQTRSSELMSTAQKLALKQQLQQQLNKELEAKFDSQQVGKAMGIFMLIVENKN